ncbi:S-adenosyl-L-methionine-dependent methyltransferase [Fusarium flagelliforme]|uniref:tRNA N(3)-methylcytidine methyltransferase n=1 Tax=Fusarium flagelliforme TaxID=2675880 RepID=A0A395N3D2_9HYPO|nr:S-adenosyl-L-methionine-dependent methyltransferase [Fusarium flagelliforme]KAH7189144.1 S-adenosyl-L-methionine-dependent methyltransferase [Fusarium flagelliforme]RFN54636.1 putative abp140-actin filament-binding protein [Fusarium flagelliforme]
MASSALSGEAVASPTLESIPAPVQDMAALNVKDPVTEAVTEAVVPETEAAEVPPHRSHDPTNNLKRSDPFQFGSRYLSEGDDVFEFNAWDHVETDDAYKEYAEQQFAKQRQHPVSDFEKRKFSQDPARWWNLFYKNNAANFFKNRKWLQQEFPVLAEVTKEDAGPKLVLEIGAGAGNTAFPVLAENKNPQLKIHACDYSKTAVEVIRKNEAYNTDFIQADVWDVASDSLPPGLEEGSVDVAVLIFIFSALSPDQWAKAVDNVHRVLKPGGLVCFRDYGRGDLAQVRFRKGRYLDENFYIRGDGTRVYFFDKDELSDIWTGKKADKESETALEPATPAVEGADVAQSTDTEAAETEIPRFEVENLGVDRRLLVNRASKLKMYRCWLQGRFRKK